MVPQLKFKDVVDGRLYMGVGCAKVQNHLILSISCGIPALRCLLGWLSEDPSNATQQLLYFMTRNFMYMCQLHLFVLCQ